MDGVLAANVHRCYTAKVVGVVMASGVAGSGEAETRLRGLPVVCTLGSREGYFGGSERLEQAAGRLWAHVVKFAAGHCGGVESSMGKL